MPVDINTAIEAYSHSFGNRMEPLRVLYPGDPELASTLSEQIDGLQNGVFELVWARSDASGLSVSEIERIARDYLAASQPHVNEIGIQGLMRYIVWLAWHEGCLRREPQEGERSIAADPPATGR